MSNYRYTLENFQIEELQIILEHFKLGIDHLKKQLTPKQFKELESYGWITKSEKDEFKINKIENFSSLSMIYNSIITGVVGVWIGLATLFEMDVVSKLAQVSGFSFLFGAIMGAVFIYANKNESLKALSQQKIQICELMTLDLMHQKQEERLNKLIQKLRDRYQKISHQDPEKEPSPFDKKEDFFSWFYLFHQAIHTKLNQFPKGEIFQYYREEVLKLLKQTEESFIPKSELVGNFAFSLNKKEELTPTAEIPPLEVLIDPTLSTPKVPIDKISWHSQEIFELAFALFPTLIGALGSILMWCNSASLFTQIFDFNYHHDLLSISCIPYVKIGISFLFTLNFLFFFYYSKKRDRLRKYNIELKKKEILNQETTVVQMTQRLNLVYFLDARLEEMMKYLEFANILQKNENKLSSERAQMDISR